VETAKRTTQSQKRFQQGEDAPVVPGNDGGDDAKWLIDDLRFLVSENQRRRSLLRPEDFFAVRNNPAELLACRKNLAEGGVDDCGAFSQL
jgi:hypothetical protein